jgi:hypothetical protein
MAESTAKVFSIPNIGRRKNPVITAPRVAPIVLKAVARPTVLADEVRCVRIALLAAVKLRPKSMAGMNRKIMPIDTLVKIMVPQLNPRDARLCSRNSGILLNQYREDAEYIAIPRADIPNMKSGDLLLSAIQPRSIEPSEIPSRKIPSIVEKE